MLACVDVHYEAASAVAACVLFEHWTAATACAELVQPICTIADYEPGQFYKRELPCLLAVLARVSDPLETIVIDGYVWLTDEPQPGLGAHLYHALNDQVPVIGAAKSRYPSANTAREVRRGDSQRPLFVTAAGLEVAVAAQKLAQMHGPYRLPTLLKAVDRLCRSGRR